MEKLVAIYCPLRLQIKERIGPERTAYISLEAPSIVVLHANLVLGLRLWSGVYGVVSHEIP